VESLSKPELLALLGAAKKKRTRDWLMILVAYQHGLRANEVVGGWRVRVVDKKKKLKQRYFHPGICTSDVRDDHLTVARAKGSMRTVQPLVEDDNPLLNERLGLFEYTRRFNGDARLFPLTRQRFFQLMREHGETAGLPIRKLHPHVLKATIAMHTIHSAGIENVRQYLGHKSISSTGAYLKVTDADASAAIAQAKMGSST
jgi:site-specific recombinase XerD